MVPFDQRSRIPRFSGFSDCHMTNRTTPHRKPDETFRNLRFAQTKIGLGGVRFQNSINVWFLNFKSTNDAPNASH